MTTEEQNIYPPIYNGTMFRFKLFTRRSGYLKDYISVPNQNVIKSIRDKLFYIINSMNITKEESIIEIKDNLLSVTLIPTYILTDAVKLGIADSIQIKYNQGCVKNIELETTLRQESALINLNPEVDESYEITEKEANEINSKINNIDFGPNTKVGGYWWNKDTDELLLTFNKRKSDKVNQKEKYKNFFKGICVNASSCYRFIVENAPAVEKATSYIDNFVNKTLNISIKVACLGVGLCALVILEQVATNFRRNRLFLISRGIIGIIGTKKI